MYFISVPIIIIPPPLQRYLSPLPVEHYITSSSITLDSSVGGNIPLWLKDFTYFTHFTTLYFTLLPIDTERGKGPL
jgi:hypothetical protein